MRTAHSDPGRDVQPFRPTYRPVDIEVQRSTVTGGWESIALAESPQWAFEISHALNWLEHNPTFSEAV